MSVKIMTLVWAVDLPDSEKLVLLALADCANDEGLAWPSMATLTRKCSKSDRTIQAAVKSLVQKGQMTREEVPGKGCRYHLHPRSDFAPEDASPPKRLRPRSEGGDTPEAASDKPSKNHQYPQKASPSSEARASKPQQAHRLPEDWQPEPFKAGSVSDQIVSAWPAGRLERELSKFRDFWTAASGQRARKHDWQAAWRTWIANADDFGARNGTVQNGNADRGAGSKSAALALIRDAEAEERAARADWNPQSDWLAGDALPRAIGHDARRARP